MIEFSLPFALAVIFFSAFLPGAILSFAILKKSDFSFLEKIIAGFAFGWIAQGLIPLAEFLFLGIKFSYPLALANTGILYALAIGLFIFLKAYEGIGPFLPDVRNIRKEPPRYAVPAFVILIFVLNFWVRIQTLSPVFQELDPYFYIYAAQQVVVQGYNPLDDQTAWYPELKVHHRGVPFESYSEATWYSLYSQGQQYNNYILSLVANIYPPFAAAFAAFFLYLGLRAWYRQEYAIIASAIASFVPIFILKLAAGEAEVQPYAFFALAMFMGFFLWAQKKQSLGYMALAGVGYMATSMGSSSEVVAATIFMLFTILQAVTLFLMKKDMETFVKLSGVFLAFSILTAILKSLTVVHPIISYPAANAAAVAFAVALFLLQRSKIDFEMQFYALGGVVLAGILLLALTPLGGIIKGVALTGLQIAEYTLPLHRTIAEQGTSGAVFEPSLGFIGKIFDHGIYVFLGYIFLIPSALANLAFSLFSALLNSVFGINLDYTDKENSLLMTLLFFSMVASAYGIYRMVKKDEESPAWFFVALIFPIALVGLIKAKYVIYLGFVLAAAIPFIFGELEALIAGALKFADENRRNLFYFFLAVGIITASMQFLESSAPQLLKAGFATRFQDDPAALQQKFSDLCDQLRLKGQEDADICAAAKDPVGYANRSVNSQYDYKLCFLSLVKDPFDQNEDRSGAAYRCERVSDYWIDSMEWIRYHTENNSRITSWWDYGHWENFFGQRNAVIRNEHQSHGMIVEIAHDYISGTPEELKTDMLRYDSRYALFDAELLFSGNSFGGKYGALNYLACARNNLTNVSRMPGTSICEYEHLWTQVYIPANPSPQEQCDISFAQKGVTAYSVKPTESAGGITYDLQPAYCLGQTTLADGQNTSALYDMNSRSADGSLKLHRAFLKSDFQTQDGRWNVFTLIYTKDPLWMADGNATSGWEDRTGKFYDSNLYRALVLEELPGFDLVYKTEGGEVKIYKIKS